MGSSSMLVRCGTCGPLHKYGKDGNSRRQLGPVRTGKDGQVRQPWLADGSDKPELDNSGE
jgi:hypothetical protein